MAINFADGSTQNHGAKIIQVKDISWNTMARLTSAGYFFGSANDSTYSFTPKSSSNKIVCQFNLAFGRSNINGGLRIHVNGGTDTGGQFFWDTRTTSSYIGGYANYQGGWNTADDSHSQTGAHGITNCSFTLVKNMSCTWPSPFYLGGYYYLNTSGNMCINRTDNSTSSGHSVSNIMIYEVEDMS